MKNETIAGLSLFYDVEEQEGACLIAEASKKSVKILYECWRLVPPTDCRVYVMTSWQQFFFHFAPWPWKIYFALTLPLVAIRARSTWPYAGGWAVQFGNRKVVGVKPPHLIKAGNRSLGEQIFLPERDLNEKVETVTVHELAHAFTFHLKLPTWLHEGLATLAMEIYLGRPIVRGETLEMLSLIPESFSTKREKLRVSEPDALIAQYARGYWLTRYLDETRPDLLKELLSTRLKPGDLEAKIASAYGKDWMAFCQGIHSELKSYFSAE
jgi:hypothetical protein